MPFDTLQVNAPRLNTSQTGLNSTYTHIPRGWKAEFPWVNGWLYIPRWWFSCPQTVIHTGSIHLVATRPRMEPKHDLLIVCPTCYRYAIPSHNTTSPPKASAMPAIATDVAIAWSVSPSVCCPLVHARCWSRWTQWDAIIWHQHSCPSKTLDSFLRWKGRLSGPESLKISIGSFCQWVTENL